MNRSTLAGPLVFVAVVIGLLAVTFWQLPKPGVSRFSTSEFAFNYPSNWEVHDQMPVTTGFGAPVAVLGTLPWGACGPSDLNCHYAERLAPGQIEVGVNHLFLMREDGICGFARDRTDISGRGPTDPQVTDTSYFRIDGRPAIYTRYAVNGIDYYQSDEWRVWMVAPWDTTDSVYEIDAKFRGPGDDQFVADLDNLVASIQLPPHFGPGYPAATPCGDPFPPI